MSKKEKKKKTVEQENKENLKQQEPEAVFKIGYKKGQRLRGLLEILAGILILCLGLWLWSRTWGIRLLFTDAAIGRLVRYYCIVLIIAVVILIVGFLTMRKVRIEKKPVTVGKDSADNTLVKHKATKEKDKNSISSDAAVTEDVVRSNAPEAEKVSTSEVEKPNTPEVEKMDVPDQMITDSSENKKIEVQSSETSKMIVDKCPGCGKDKKTGASFCIYCGHKF